MHRIEVPVHLGTRTNAQIAVAQEISIAFEQLVAPSCSILCRFGELFEDRGGDRMTRSWIDEESGRAM